MKLVIRIDLDQLPAGITVPNELCVMLNELSEKLEKVSDLNDRPHSWPLRNFEGTKIGEARVA